MTIVQVYAPQQQMVWIGSGPVCAIKDSMYLRTAAALRNLKHLNKCICGWNKSNEPQSNPYNFGLLLEFWTSFLPRYDAGSLLGYPYSQLLAEADHFWAILSEDHTENWKPVFFHASCHHGRYRSSNLDALCLWHVGLACSFPETNFRGTWLNPRIRQAKYLSRLTLPFR
jgi:hypothetical protein